MGKTWDKHENIIGNTQGKGFELKMEQAISRDLKLQVPLNV